MIGLHRCFWIWVFLFPGLGPIFGSANSAQILFHAMYGIFFVLVVSGFWVFGGARFRAQLASIPLAWVLIPIAVSLYFLLLTLVNTSRFIVAGDVVDCVRPILYLLYLLFPLVFPVATCNLGRVVSVFFFFLGVQLIFSAFVFVPSLHEMVDWYKGRMSTDFDFFQFLRWSGFFIFPSDFSFFLSFFLFWSIAVVLLGHPFSGVSWARRALCVCSALGILLSQSRGGIAAVGGTAAFVFLVTGSIFRRDVISWCLVGLCLLVVVIAGAQYFGFLELSYLIETFRSDSVESGNVGHRVLEARLALDYVSEFLLFGAGGASVRVDREIPVLESLYGFYLIKWGILGLYAYLLCVAFIVLAGFRATIILAARERHAYGDATLFIAASTMVILSVPLVFGLSSAMSDRFKALPFFFALSGYILSVDLQLARRRLGPRSDMHVSSLSS